MALHAAHRWSVFFVVLALVPSLAHVLQLPNKLDLSRADYGTVQQLYRGWALLGLIVIVALLATLYLTWLSRGTKGMTPAAVASVCILLTQVVFWGWTYPVNVATSNWTVLPENWGHLRTQWEYSHAAGAMLNLAAFSALLYPWRGRQQNPALS